jgi:hypothetical protein
MTLSKARVQHYLNSFKLQKLFVERGWDRYSGRLAVSVNSESYDLDAIAEKRGVQIFQCRAENSDAFPDFATRRKIEKQVTKSAYEHLIIFIDAAETVQIWQWVSRQPGLSAACREHRYYPRHQSGEALIQKLDLITFSLSEEEGLTLAGITFKLRDAFDRDKITKKFYDSFQKQHRGFLGFIEGITEKGDREWYASLMLNRLMFIYFIQKKGFLDQDTSYLKNRLEMVKRHKGKGNFHSFYRYFLLRLFHEGFAQKPERRKKDLESLLGKVPYLNGGLFDLHELEQNYSAIDIPDEAFENLFNFFDQYEWHLDNRPLSNDKEINPDVLGYIFEKYINQKQMGAYYTKEDITEYISKKTILPYLFNAARKKCAIAFQSDSAMWQLLRNDPLRYIYPAMRKGVFDKDGDEIPLPNNIAQGIDHVDKRGEWNQPADAEYALPTEIWREHVARRQRCLEIREKLLAGEIHQINDLITCNLDIRQFAEDVIMESEGPELLRAFYKAISTVSVLDPTCGSGAFLFAALNILEPLYDACLDRMQGFIDDLENSGKRHRPEKYSDFRKVLNAVDEHPNRRFFILKSIVVNNLYGVDIMEEAVEICKLRLFLKLVAQVDKVKQLEPLPDIDFNIRAGNTLVGYVSVDEIRKAAEADATGQTQILLESTKDEIGRIEEDAGLVEKAFNRFHEMQTRHRMDVDDFRAAKDELRNRLKTLSDQLDQYLAKEYGVDPSKKKAFDSWRTSHQPFHWLIEFYSIINQGGFDVAIGNPPYVVYSPSKVPYSIDPLEYQTLPTKNLYAYVFERKIAIGKIQSPIGLIVQLTALSSQKLPSLQNLLISRGSFYALGFPRRPESMFDGVEMPVAILVSSFGQSGEIITSRVGRIYTLERPHALHTSNLNCHKIRIDGCRIGKIGSSIDKSIYANVSIQKTRIANLAVKSSKFLVYYQEACRYWLKACVGLPFFKRNGESIVPPHGRILCLSSKDAADFVFCLLNSSLFFWYYSLFSDCEHVNDQIVKNIPIPSNWDSIQWSYLADELSKNLEINANLKTIKTKQGHQIEYHEIKAMFAKRVINDLDIELSNLYKLSEIELDYLINYDIKYRVGQ